MAADLNAAGDEPSAADQRTSETQASEARRPRRRRRPVHWIAVGSVAVVVLGLLTVFAARIGTDPTLVESPLLGKPAPSFDLPGLDGGRVRSPDLAGRPYVVNFWASWCVPCRQEAPHLRSFHERWAARGVEVIGIVWNDTESDARRFREEFGLRFPQAVDPGSRAALDFGVFGIPETYVVDGRGVVMAKLVGAVGPTTLDEVLTDVMAGETRTESNEDYRTGRSDS